MLTGCHQYTINAFLMNTRQRRRELDVCHLLAINIKDVQALEIGAPSHPLCFFPKKIQNHSLCLHCLTDLLVVLLYSLHVSPCAECDVPIREMTNLYYNYENEFGIGKT